MHQSNRLGGHNYDTGTTTQTLHDKLIQITQRRGMGL